MPLTDSMEKPPAAERTPGPIAVFSNSYARLPEHFFARLAPTPVAKPHLIKFNDALASERLGVNTQGLDPDRAGGDVCRQRLHRRAQSRSRWSMPGISSAISFLSLATAAQSSSAKSWTANGERRDVQLKGAGRTRFSQRGDGRAALGPVLREYLVSEAMHALGIPTTRALAAVSTSELVYRDRQLLEPC